MPYKKNTDYGFNLLSFEEKADLVFNSASFVARITCDGRVSTLYLLHDMFIEECYNPKSRQIEDIALVEDSDRLSLFCPELCL